MNRTEAKNIIQEKIKKLAAERKYEIFNDTDNLTNLLRVLNNDGLLYLLNRCEEADNGNKNTYGEIFEDFDGLKVDSNNAKQEAFIKGLSGYKKYGKLIDDITAVADKQKFFEILYANRIVDDYNNFKRKKFVNVMSVFEKIFNWSSKKEQETQKKTLNKIIEFVHDNNTDSIDLFKRLCEADLLLDCFYDKYIQGLDSNGKISLPKYWRPNVRGNYKKEQAKEVWINTKANAKKNHYSNEDELKDDLKYFYELYRNEKKDKSNIIISQNVSFPCYVSFDKKAFTENPQGNFINVIKDDKNGIFTYSSINAFKDDFKNYNRQISSRKFEIILLNFIENYRQREIALIEKDKKLSDKAKKVRLKIINNYFSDWKKFEVIFDEEKFKSSMEDHSLDVAIQDSVMLQNKEDFTRHPGWDLGHLPGHEYKIMHLVYVLTDLFDPKFQENVIGKNKSYIEEKVLNKQEYGEQLKSLELIENELKNCHDENEKIRKRNEILKKQDEIIKKINKTESPKEEKQSKDDIKEDLKKHLREIVKNTWLKYSSENDKDKIFLKIFQDYENYEAETSTFNQGHKGDTKLSNKEIFEVILEIENEFKTGAIEWKKQ